MNLTFAAGLVLSQVLTMAPDFTVNPHNKPAEAGQELRRNWHAHSTWRTTVWLDSDGVALLAGNVGVQIEKCDQDENALVSIRLWVNGEPVEQPAWPIGTRMNTNVYQGQHYHSFVISWAVPLPAGRNRIHIETWAKGHDGSACRTFFKSREFNGVTLLVFEE